MNERARLIIAILFFAFATVVFHFGLLMWFIFHKIQEYRRRMEVNAAMNDEIYEDYEYDV
jgi:sensor histidine kinase regulating citrate/malate metabolism